MSELVNFITPGVLGSCWCGKYHYLEPWIGCEHDCFYCYGRSRHIVNDLLTFYGTRFSKPILPFELDKVIAQILEEIKINEVQRLKLSRYTDIFTPCFVKDGSALKILEKVCETTVKRIIITTKGIPDKAIISLIKQHKDKFSYNAVVKPECEQILDANVVETEERLKILSDLNLAGVTSTVHLDPLAFSVLMSEKEWLFFLSKIKSYGLNRLMFSYLMLDDTLISYIKGKLNELKFNELLQIFATDKKFKQPYANEELVYIKENLRSKHIEMMRRLLEELKIDYVLCSLKSLKGDGIKLGSQCNLCDGTFYA